MQINQSIGIQRRRRQPQIYQRNLHVWACGNHRNISHIIWNLSSRTVGNHKNICQIIGCLVQDS